MYLVANGEERLRNAFRVGLFLSTALALGGLPGCNVGGSITSSHEPSNDGVVPPTDPGGSPTGPGELTTVAFTESSATPVNPERGFYVGLDLVGAAGGAAGVRDRGHALAIALVRLDAYRSQPLDAALLSQLDAGFASVRAAGIKVILRFTYNSSQTDDAPRDVILGHIAQLAPVLGRNADVIAVMQAGFIGAWGEWHSSTHGLDNDADRAAILTGILAALPASRGVQVRTPMFKAAIFPGGALTEAQAFDGSNRARVGHHNDCFLASDSDLGTYAAPVSQWEDYVSKEGLYTAVGGETCAVAAPRTDCGTAVAEMEANHWSYLNLEYNQAVLAGWTSQGCDGEVQQRLGYRFVLQQASYTLTPTAGGVFELAVDVLNRGFAAPFNARPVYVVFSGEGGRHVLRLEGVDTRRFAPGQAVTLSAQLRLPPAMVAGVYAVSLWLPDAAETLRDDPRYAIQLANDGVWNAATGENVLVRELHVQP